MLVFTKSDLYKINNMYDNLQRNGSYHVPVLINSLKSFFLNSLKKLMILGNWTFQFLVISRLWIIICQMHFNLFPARFFLSEEDFTGMDTLQIDCHILIFPFTDLSCDR